VFVTVFSVSRRAQQRLYVTPDDSVGGQSVRCGRRMDCVTYRCVCGCTNRLWLRRSVLHLHWVTSSPAWRPQPRHHIALYQYRCHGHRPQSTVSAADQSRWCY